MYKYFCNNFTDVLKFLFFKFSGHYKPPNNYCLDKRLYSLNLSADEKLKHNYYCQRNLDTVSMYLNTSKICLILKNALYNVNIFCLYSKYNKPFWIY